jgi:hypothetical protein
MEEYFSLEKRAHGRFPTAHGAYLTGIEAADEATARVRDLTLDGIAHVFGPFTRFKEFSLSRKNLL